MTDGMYESWGRFPKLEPAGVERLRWRNELPRLGNYDKKILPYGLGKSYGDSCQNEKGILLDASGLNKFISFDGEKGIIRCEAGVTLAQVLDFTLPKGWFLAATPGTKFCSVGGAIANDVHGKNHHRGGTFGCHVTQFELVRSNGERLICSPEQNKELFSATIGGLGLTGLITWTEFRLKPSPSEFFEVDSIKFDNVEEFFDITGEADEKYEYTVSWVDCTATGASLGRGIFTGGNHAHPKDHELPEPPRPEPKPFPFDAPFINPLTVGAFNILYFNKQLMPSEFSVQHYDSFFYPLDGVLNWNRAYGKNGFLQYQFVIPFDNALAMIKRMLRMIAASGLSSFLTVLKSFGDVQSPGMLSFPRPGITMAIDFRMDGERTLRFLESLDEVVREAGGALYPAKDARMSPADFRRAYPNWKEFAQYIDPAFSSSFWRRVMDNNNM